jgi:uncharacterized membrane protein YidH (DUF202 family)
VTGRAGDDRVTGVRDSAADHTGLQAERTQLAWVRTALAIGALVAVATRLAGGDESTVLAAVLGVSAALPGLTAALLRIRTLQRQPVPEAATPSTVALLATSLALADGLVLALLVV